MGVLKAFCVVWITVAAPGTGLGQRTPPLRWSLGGLCELQTEFIAPSGRNIHAAGAAGDVDGDGRDDLLIRTRPKSSSTDEPDLVFVVYGQSVFGERNTPIDEGIRTTSISTGSFWWFSSGLHGEEDVNGDGRPDLLIISGHEDRVEAPALLLIHGGVLPSTIDGNQVGESVRGSLIYDEREVREDQPFGDVAALLPDVNGDGRAEVAVLERDYGDSWITRLRCFILFGSEELPALIEVHEIGASLDGFVVETTGPPGERMLAHVSGLGDLDGDGLSETAFMTTYRFDSTEISYVIYGRESFQNRIVVEELPADEGFRLPLVESIAGVGDVNGDGLGEFVAQAPVDDKKDFLRGDWLNVYRARLIRGRPREEFPEELDRETIEGIEGVTTIRTHNTSGLPFFHGDAVLSLSRGKDIDGDGDAEFLYAYKERHIVYPNASIRAPGTVCLLWGDENLPQNIVADVECERVQDPGVIGTRLECPYSPRALATVGLGAQIDGLDDSAQMGEGVAILSDFDGDSTADFLVVGHPWGSPVRRVQLVSGRAVQRGDRPRLGSTLPAEGSVLGGDTVMLFGTGFDGEGLEVRFDGRPAEIEEILGAGILVVTTPPGLAVRTVGVEVLTSVGRSSGCGVQYTYTPVVDGIAAGDARARTLSLRRSEPERFRTLGLRVGDFDGDELLDLAFLDRREENGMAFDGELQLLLGRTAAIPAKGDVVLEEIDDAELSKIHLRQDELRAGDLDALHSVGDVNGDGRDDLLLSVYGDVPGQLFFGNHWRLVLGRAEFDPEGSLADLDDTTALWVESAGLGGNLFLGGSSIVPDLDGDGLDELVFSAFRPVHPPGLSILYVVRGSRDWPDTLSLERLFDEGRGSVYTTDMTFNGPAGSAGDFDGDGLADLYFSGLGWLTEGSVLILFGGEELVLKRARIDRGLLDDGGGYLISADDLFKGDELAFVAPGDMDGDGDSDVLVRFDTVQSCTPGPCSGEGFIFDAETAVREAFSEETFPEMASAFRQSDVERPDFAVRSGEPQDGVFKLIGDQRGQALGARSGPAGDFNGDGFPDLILGSLRAQPELSSGNRCHIVFGSADLYEHPLLDLTKNSERSLKIEGFGRSDFGRFVEGGFDWDADGYDDVWIGSSEGRADLIFGMPGTSFLRGDADANGMLEINDAVSTLVFQFVGTFAPTCLDALDWDDSAVIDISDPIASLSHQFLGGPDSAAPGSKSCGVDPTRDSMSCETFEACAVPR